MPDHRGSLFALAAAGFLLLPAAAPPPPTATAPAPRLGPTPARESPAQEARFDLWIYGRGLGVGDHRIFLERNRWTGGGWERLLPEESTIAQSPRGPRRATAYRPGGEEGWGTRLVRGLPRSQFLGQDLRVGGLTLKLVPAGPVRVAAVLAMPGGAGAAGRMSPESGAFPLAPSADTSTSAPVERTPGRLRAASLAHHVYPHPVDLGPGDTLVLRVEGRVRDRKPGVLEVEWLDLLWRSGG